MVVCAERERSGESDPLLAVEWRKKPLLGCLDVRSCPGQGLLTVGGQG
ncbi:hypothetical protein [Prauserella alba]|nr:hypothetical protein [Prauserella alba]